jgi:hypothetical protein
LPNESTIISENRSNDTNNDLIMYHDVKRIGGEKLEREMWMHGKTRPVSHLPPYLLNEGYSCRR